MLLGLMGEKPDDVDPTTIDAKLDEIRQKQVVRLWGQYPIVFNQKYDLSFRKNEILSGHSNRMRFLGREHAKPIWKLIFENEKSLRSEQEIFGDMSRIWHAMKDCTRRDLETKGSLGAGLKIQPRAPELY